MAIHLHHSSGVVLRFEVKDAQGLVPDEPVLREYLHAVSNSADRLPDDGFAVPEPVNRCGVYGGHAQVDSPANARYCVFVIRAAPHPAADSPCTKYHCRHRNIAVTQLPVFHRSAPLRQKTRIIISINAQRGRKKPLFPRYWGAGAIVSRQLLEVSRRMSA